MFSEEPPLLAALTAPHPAAAPPLAAARGFDVFVNMVLEDVEEYEITPEGKKVRDRARACTEPREWRAVHPLPSLLTAPPPSPAPPAPPPAPQVTKLDQILLNGNNIAVLVPGGKPDE